MNQVSLPAFSRMQDDKKRLQRWFLMSSRTMATGSYGPIILGVLVMPELIPLLFGPKWEPAVLPTQLLALVSMRQMTMMLIGPLFQALGKTKEQFYWTIVAVAATVVGIVIGLQWGIVGVAAGVTISMYLLAPLQIAVAARMVGFRGSEYTRALAPAWIAAAAMVVVWIPARTLCSAIGIPALVAATLCGLLSLAAYVLTLRFGFKELYDSMHEVALMLVRRKGGRRRPRRITARADELTRMPQMRCLWVSGDVPHPPTYGKFVYSAALSEALAGAGVEVVGVGLGERRGPMCAATAVTWDAVAATRRGRLTSVASRLPSMTFATTPLRDRVRSLLAGSHWDAVVVDHLETGWVADLVPAGGPPVVYIAHNHESSVRREVAAQSDDRMDRRAALRLDAEKAGRLEARLGAPGRAGGRDHGVGRGAVRSRRARGIDHRPDSRLSGAMHARRARSTRRRRVRRPSSRASTGT